MMFIIYKSHKNLFFELPKILEYLVFELKNAIILTILFMKKLVGIYTMARFTSTNHPSFSSKLKLF